MKMKQGKAEIPAARSVSGRSFCDRIFSNHKSATKVRFLASTGHAWFGTAFY